MKAQLMILVLTLCAGSTAFAKDLDCTTNGSKISISLSEAEEGGGDNQNGRAYPAFVSIKGLDAADRTSDYADYEVTILEKNDTLTAVVETTDYDSQKLVEIIATKKASEYCSGCSGGVKNIYTNGTISAKGFDDDTYSATMLTCTVK
jgi:hypothetical protein